ncbi:MAG TPA: PD-(D/E)XK nuclease family protein [Methanocorpusculum sp.]|nr:PD-(D/E)XK nuclease family protein [Methanocorpusculum sp.]
MTSVPDDTSLSSALAAWQPMLSHQEDTWFFCTNDETVQTVLSSLHTPVLKDHITTLRSFAKQLVTERCPDLTIITFEEQTAVLYHIIKQLPWGKKTRSLPIALVSDLIGRYHFFRQHYIDLGRYLDEKTRPKHQLLATIYAEYERYCGDRIIDEIGVMKKAIELLNEDNPVKSGVIYHIQPTDLLTQTLLDAVASNRNVREFKRPVCEIATPKTLKTPILKYRTAKDEIEATLETIATLLESGAEPDDILIISPKAESAAKLIGECIGDFAYRKDEQYVPLNCTGLETPLSSYPIIQAVSAAVSAIQNRRFALEDLQTITSLDCFPNHPMVSVDDLTKFSIMAGVSENEYEWMHAISRLESDCNLAETGTRIRDLIEWLKTLDDESSTYRTRTAALRNWLSASGWIACTDITEEESRARDLLLTFFAEFTETETGDIPCDLFTYSTNFHEFLQHATVSRRAGRRNSVRFCKLKDAADLSAKHVFIIALTAENIPSQASVLSPFSMKETADLCRKPDGTPFSLSDLQYDQEQQNFAAALQTATVSLTLSCHLANGSSNTAPSSFLTRIGEPQDPVPVPLTHSVWYDQIAAGTAIRTQSPIDRPLLSLPDPDTTAEIIGRETCGYASDFSASPARSVFAETYKNHIYSATEIETYLTCPYKWYLSKFVRLQNPQDKYAETTNYGSLVHAGLETFVSKNGRKLTEMSAEETEQAVIETLRKTFADYPFISSPTWRAKISRCLGDAYPGQVPVFRQFSCDEVAYARDGWFSIPPVRDPETDEVLVPGDLECTIDDVTVTYREESMRVKGFIDRVMRKPDGTFRIVDYKTGAGFIRDLDHLVQIPLYAEAFAVMHPELKSAGGHYLCLKNTDQYGIVSPGLKTGDAEESWEETRDRVLSLAFSAKRDIESGIASRNGMCRPDYCPYKDICRRGNLAEVPEEEEES